MTSILMSRMLKYIRSKPELSEIFEGDDDATVVSELEEDAELLGSIVTSYKLERWSDFSLGAVGAMPCTSLKEVERVSRKADEKFLVMCGWHNPEGGISGVCAFCGIPLSLHEMTIDHIVPRARKGSEQLSNLVPACPDCNRLKSDRSAADFLHSQGMSVEHIAEWSRDVENAIRFREQSSEVWQFRLSEAQKSRLGLSDNN